MNSGVWVNGKEISKSPIVISDGEDKVVLKGVVIHGSAVLIDKTGKEKKILGRPVKRRKKG